MKNGQTLQRWLTLLADSGGATLYALGGPGPESTLLGVQHVTYALAELEREARLPGLEDFVARHGLQGCRARLFFMGAGTVVHKLTLPVMSVRQRARAIRTRLTTYAAGRELCIDQRIVRREGRHVREVVAGGTDAALVRGLWQAAAQAGLRVEGATALSAAATPPSASGRAVQVLMGERTTAIQLFAEGELVFCRDVLFGRQDLVAAYQRPIISLEGPVRLTPEQAERLVREVGVPEPKAETGLEGVRAEQLWPLVTPALQKLQAEIEQTLAQTWKERDPDTGLCVLGLPRVPGLTAHLAAELDLTPLLEDEQVERSAIRQLGGSESRRFQIDLAPPEERFVRRMTRPALAAAGCAFLVIFANSGSPQVAHAARERLAPANRCLAENLAAVTARRAAVEQACLEHATTLAHQVKLRAAMPARLPVSAVFRALFATVPPGVRLLDAGLELDTEPVFVNVAAEYQGAKPPGVAASEWAHAIAERPLFAEAEVLSVDGGEEDGRATFMLRIRLP